MDKTVTSSQSGKILALIKMVRPPNSITAGIAVVAACLLAINEGEKTFSPLTYLSISGAAFFVTAHAMVHNDIVDFEADKINSPQRPLPSNIISMKTAKLWAIFLFIMACLCGIVIDIQLNLKYPISLGWAILNAGLLDGYNLWFKKSGIWGNMVVGYVVSALFIYADIIVSKRFTLRIESLALYAFFMNWGREVIKGIRDIEGDRTLGVKTIAVRFGAKGGAIVGSLMLFIAVIGTIPLIFDPQGSIAIPYILTVFNTIIVYRCLRLIQHPTVEYATTTKRIFLYLMLLAVIVLMIDQLVLLFVN